MRWLNHAPTRLARVAYWWVENHRHLAFRARLRIRLRHRRLVRGELLLQCFAGVARRARQVLLRIIQFIHVQVQLRLGNLQVFFAPRRRSQAAHLRLVIFRRLLQLRDLSRQRQCFSRRGRVLPTGLPQRRGKRLISLMVSQAFCLMRKLFLFLAHGEGRQRLGNLPGMQVDQGRFGC